jgi:two-component system phosphate regulon sensor histidine kinase PhoR
VEDRFDREHAAELERQLSGLTDDQIRVTLILTDGTVLADSKADRGQMESHASRAEVREALESGWGRDTRVSRTLGRNLTYLAVRVGPPEAPRGVVRTAMAVRSIGERATARETIIWTIALVGLAAAVIFALGLSWLWSKPIGRITETARGLSRGDFSARARVISHDELGVLARSLNEMRQNIVAQLTTIDRQRRTLESLLAQLHEAVVVAGPDGRVILINPAALAMLGTAPADPDAAKKQEGKTVEQCVPQYQLQQLLVPGSQDASNGQTEDHASRDPRMQEVRLQLDAPAGKVSVLARAADIVLPGLTASHTDGASSATMGRLLVLTDITELNRMIQVRADFAANASHELRTPLSAIRAAVETLMNLDFARDTESARQFAAMIERHSTRLEEMVSDLLALSRLESSPAQFRPEPVRIAELVSELHSHFRDRIEARQLHWSVVLAPDAETILASSHLLRLILQNLIDNAIQFTEPDGHIRIVVARQTDPVSQLPSASIAVEDTGCGIPEEEQNRVFERFYQVEKMRSGEGRGTGLGLSIVRHAAAAMKARLDLQSRPGQGTRVTIHIPQPA